MLTHTLCLPQPASCPSSSFSIFAPLTSSETSSRSLQEAANLSPSTLLHLVSSSQLHGPSPLTFWSSSCLVCCFGCWLIANYAQVLTVCLRATSWAPPPHPLRSPGLSMSSSARRFTCERLEIRGGRLCPSANGCILAVSLVCWSRDSGSGLEVRTRSGPSSMCSCPQLLLSQLSRPGPV